MAEQNNQFPCRWSGADMRCPKCNKYLPDRCTCNGPSIEERRLTDHQTSPVGEDAERTEFEAWYVKEAGESRAFMLGRNSNGEYAYAETESMWLAWQAARRAAPTQHSAHSGSVDTPKFRELLGEITSAAEVSGRYGGGEGFKDELVATAALIAHIDAWAGSRAGDAVPDGWKLVPVEPTNKMTAIGQDLRYKSVNSIGAIYHAMLAAAPAPGKQAGNDQEAHNRAGKEQE